MGAIANWCGIRVGFWGGLLWCCWSCDLLLLGWCRGIEGVREWTYLGLLGWIEKIRAWKKFFRSEIKRDVIACRRQELTVSASGLHCQGAC